MNNFKRSLTLGLIVFVVGAMLTACGSKNNTTNTTNNTTPPTALKGIDNSSDGCTNCIKSFDGTFYLASNADLYLQAFGHNTQTDSTFFGGNTVFDQLANAVLQPVAGLVVCGAKTYLTTQIAKALKIDNVDVSCTQEDLNYFQNVSTNSSNQSAVASSYAARIRVHYNGSGQADQLELTINSNLGPNGADDVEYFNFQSTGLYVNNANTMSIVNTDGYVRLATINGQVIGEFR